MAPGNESLTIELVRKAQSGDQEAFCALVRSCQPRVESLVAIRLGRRLRKLVEVEDVLQETYLRAYKSILKFHCENDHAFFHWLCGIAEHVIRNLVRYHFQTGKRDRNLEACFSHSASGRLSHVGRRLRESTAVSPARSLQREERFERLEKALDSLSHDHRDVIIQARVRQLPIKEIARKMGRSSDAVSMLLRRALQQLRSHFGGTESHHLPDRRLDGSDARAPGESPDGPASESS